MIVTREWTENQKRKQSERNVPKRQSQSHTQLFRGLNATGNPGRRCFCCCIANDTPDEPITGPENDGVPCAIIAVDNKPF